MPITINKATVTDHGSSSGWIDTYGDGIAAWQPLTFSTSNWVFDGSTGGGPGSWKSGHGFRFENPACTRAAFVSTADGLSNITIRHASFTQTGDTTRCSNASVNVTHGIYTAAGGEGTIFNSSFEYLYFDNLGGLPFFLRGGSGNVIQYNYSGDICGEYVADVSAHCEMLVVHGMNDTHFRYNYIAESPSSGGFVKNDYETSTRIYIYGNVIRGRLPIACNTGVCSSWMILNNTFADMGTGPVAGDGNASTSLIYNNIAYNGIVVTFWNVSSRSYDYTWYSRISGNSCHMLPGSNDNVAVGYSHGCDVIPTSTDPFISSSGTDPESWTLKAPIVGYPGTNVCALVSCSGNSTFDRDAFGKQRGADGIWDRGAYEFTRPAAPTNLRISRN